MVEGKVIIKNETGLHARPASQFIAFANRFTDAEITVLCDGKKANAKSILNLLTMGLNRGCEMIIQVVGGNEQKVLDDTIDFVNSLKD